ncbi:putative ATP-binding cassette transporter protein [Xylariomycetidae sp. FL2044]|nr:putative ATP-binding cassette transporter protein [Xylariomycetidae sp. FL2044]
MFGTTLTLASSAAGLAVIGLTSVPVVLSAISDIRVQKRPSPVYQDEDGISTREATEAYSNKFPKASISLFSVAGLSISIAIAVLSTIQPRGTRDNLLLENWLVVGAFALLTLQAISVASTRNSVAAYRLGALSSLSSVILAVVLAIQDNQIAAHLLVHDRCIFGLRIAEIVIIIGLALAGISIPRRPDVYHDGKLVDKRLTNSLWSLINWAWPWEVIRTAHEKNNLDLEDLPRPDHHTRSLERTAAWEAHGFTGPLWISIISAYKWLFLLQWILTLATAFLNLAPQWVVLQLLELLENRQGHENLGYDAWKWVIWLAVSIIAQSWVESYIFWLSWADIMLPVRSQLSSLIFQKSLRLRDVKEARKKKTASVQPPKSTLAGPAGASSNADTPEVDEEDDAEQANKSKQSTVNLIGVDTKRVAEFTAQNYYFPGSLFKLAVSIVFLLRLLKWQAVLAGCGAMLLVMPVNIYFSKRYSDAQDRLMKVRDEKMEVVNEALQGIRQIKFSALESQWQAKVGEVREKELESIWTVLLSDLMLLACWISGPILMSAASLAVYAAVHGSLSPSVAFVSLGVFKGLEVALSLLPELTTDLLDAWVSVKRMDAYLQGAEVSEIIQEAEEVSFDNATIAWPSDNDQDDPDRFVLRDINVTFPKGELSVISGQTGSGKTLMLSAILGEVDLLAGSILAPKVPSLHERHDSSAHQGNWILPGAIAYVSQIPWIENLTFKDNILFGLPFDESRYKQTVEACALKKDLEMLSDGDSTELGANGVNLSGGQKWRITLARAIYSRAGILVLDDIFSAVDAHVGRHIFENCINGDLCFGRTRILVTHHVALCQPKTKFLVELGGGRVLNAGLLDDLAEAGKLDKIKSHEQTEQEIRSDEESTAVNSENDLDGEPIGESLAKIPSKTQEARKFVEEESREKGAIKKKVYLAYMNNSGSWIFWTGALILFLVVQALTVGRSWWLKIWTGTREENVRAEFEHQPYTYQFSLQQSIHDQHEHTDPVRTMLDSDHGLVFYLGIYVFLSILTSFLSTMRWLYVFSGSIRASRELFEKLNFRILRAPMRWLDTVPTGRILNRYTGDFHTVDTRLAYSLSFFGNALLNMIGVIVAGVFVSPYIIALAAVLLAASVAFGQRYLQVARPVKRLESVGKSPVFEQFGSSLTGVLTIRAFDKKQIFIDRMYKKVDDWTAATWHLWLTNRWIGWRMGLVGSFFASFVAILILVSPQMSSALAGFALAFALEFSGTVMWTIRHYANVELDMNAAERVVEYTELPTERLDGAKAPASWPSEGRVEVNDLEVSYADDLPPVLKGLTFSINANERIGVVGRTGAGKSSLTLALFRFLEARSGTIYIDGLDISKLRLHDLRSRLAIIPQDPVLFSGTVRTNLDPFDNHTDEELFDSLRRVHLISDTESDTDTSPPTPTPDSPATNDTTRRNNNTNIFGKLSSPISEGGLNLSQGQRQLLCLARAIVSRPKVMVLDEATSAVDMATDALIQRSIREEFQGSTLIVIAHRLSTIADFDRILVMSEGRVAEYGTPRELWEMGPGEGQADGDGDGGVAGSVFRGMCEQSGEREHLRRIVYGEGAAA